MSNAVLIKMRSTDLITGITNKDGYYLIKLLLNGLTIVVVLFFPLSTFPSPNGRSFI